MGSQKDKNSQNDLFRRYANRLITKVKASGASNGDPAGSWEELEKELSAMESQKKGKRRRIQAIVSAVAASVLVVIGLSTWYVQTSSQQSLLTELNTYAGNSSEEISLITSHSQLLLKNEAKVGYTKSGVLSVNQTQIESSGEKSDKKQGDGLNHLVVPKGRRMHLTLSDGTRLVVNAGSRVVYPTLFDKSRREIAVEGEVYLEVAHNSKWPFYVKTDGFDVKVLGTSFNVSAYKDEAVAAVTLVEGSVEIAQKNKKIRLLPEHVAFISEKGMDAEKVDVLPYICWKDNMFMLNKDHLGTVLKRLSRYYGVLISYEGRTENIPISGKLDLKEDIGFVLSTIGESLNLRCQKRGDADYYLSTK